MSQNGGLRSHRTPARPPEGRVRALTARGGDRGESPRGTLRPRPLPAEQQAAERPSGKDGAGSLEQLRWGPWGESGYRQTGPQPLF